MANIEHADGARKRTLDLEVDDLVRVVDPDSMRDLGRSDLLFRITSVGGGPGDPTVCAFAPEDHGLLFVGYASQLRVVQRSALTFRRRRTKLRLGDLVTGLSSASCHRLVTRVSENGSVDVDGSGPHMSSLVLLASRCILPGDRVAIDENAFGRPRIHRFEGHPARWRVMTALHAEPGHVNLVDYKISIHVRDEDLGWLRIEDAGQTGIPVHAWPKCLPFPGKNFAEIEAAAKVEESMQRAVKEAMIRTWDAMSPGCSPGRTPPVVTVKSADIKHLEVSIAFVPGLSEEVLNLAENLHATDPEVVAFVCRATEADAGRPVSAGQRHDALRTAWGRDDPPGSKARAIARAKALDNLLRR